MIFWNSILRKQQVAKVSLHRICSSLDLYGKFKSKTGGLKMPLNVRRLFASIFLVVFSFIIVNAQQPQQMQPQKTIPPTSGDVMRGRISKAKAFIAVKNYNAAIYELENIRRETNDQTVYGVLNVQDAATSHNYTLSQHAPQ